MSKINTYLAFDGTAAEAMRFYEKVLGGKIGALVKFKDMPQALSMPEGDGDKVIHAELSLKEGGVLMASDWVAPKPYEGMKGFSIALAFETASEATRVFTALTEGGFVIMPLQPSFFAETFGMLVDRFGAPWAISGGSQAN